MRVDLTARFRVVLEQLSGGDIRVDRAYDEITFHTGNRPKTRKLPIEYVRRTGNVRRIDERIRATFNEVLLFNDTAAMRAAGRCFPATFRRANSRSFFW